MRLLESTHAPRRSRTGTLLSVIAHAAAIGCAVAATARATTTPPRERVDRLIYTAPTPTPPRDAPRPAAPRTATAPASPTTPTADMPPIAAPTISIPATIPSPSTPLAGLAESFAQHGVASTTAAPEGVGSGDGAPLDAFSVERAVVPLGQIRPRYPEMLRSQGVEGRASIRFVVDTGGRVEPGSAAVIAATHAAFGQAALATVGGLRFRPAEAGGHRVRQLVELPFDFVLRR